VYIPAVARTARMRPCRVPVPTPRCAATIADAFRLPARRSCTSGGQNCHLHEV